VKLKDAWKKINKFQAFKTILIVTLFFFLIGIFLALLFNNFTEFSSIENLTETFSTYLLSILIGYILFLLYLTIYFSLEKR